MQHFLSTFKPDKTQATALNPYREVWKECRATDTWMNNRSSALWKGQSLWGESSIAPSADPPKAPAEAECLGVTGKAPVSGSSSGCSLVSLGPHQTHTQGTPRVGPPDREGLSNRKARVWSCIVCEHSLLAAEVGDNWWCFRKGCPRFLWGGWKTHTALFLGDKGVALIRLRLVQMLCYVRSRWGELTDRKSKDWQKLCKTGCNFH